MINEIAKIPNILLPKVKDFAKWSVVACDQFTSQLDYWQQLASFVGSEPSTLNVIYPEVYLGKEQETRIKNINQTMQNYLDGNLFEQVNDLIFVDRTLNNGMHRLGLMLCIDLEQYDYTPQNNALIKATEKTVVERLPVRIEIRKNACLELPHVMLLVDDVNKTIIEPLANETQNMQVLYNFDLNMNGGHISGYRVNNSQMVLQKLIALADVDVMQKKYGTTQQMLFAVGDGNHSLATAKECWNLIKKGLTPQQIATHPARYSLCELVNLHDNSLVFEPIHRVVFNGGEAFVTAMKSALKGTGKTKIVYNNKETEINISSNASVAINEIQQFIDEYSKNNKIELDYIHGAKHLLKVANEGNGVAIFMPTLQKSELFGYVLKNGVYTRKSFSMGEAEDKRYYLETRKIK
ncbi:MAG: DUF1015 domain-containing protein [Clostridia bacterium]